MLLPYRYSKNRDAKSSLSSRDRYLLPCALGMRAHYADPVFRDIGAVFPKIRGMLEISAGLTSDVKEQKGPNYVSVLVRITFRAFRGSIVISR